MYIRTGLTCRVESVPYNQDKIDVIIKLIKIEIIIAET